MTKLTIIEVEQLGELVEHAIIEQADGSFTSMPKATYDAQQAEQSIPIVAEVPE